MACQIKICGITNRMDLEWIARCGANYGGVLVEIASPRGQTLDAAKELTANPPLPIVAVTQDRKTECLSQIAETLQPAALQLHGHEPAETVRALKALVSCEIWKVIHLPASDENRAIDFDLVFSQIAEFTQAGTDRFLIDATVIQQGKAHLGGTGKTVDWKIARLIREKTTTPLIVAGGLNPENAVEAVRAVRPFGIDLSSGVERDKGHKDPEKVLQLITRVRAWEQETQATC